jgi:glycine/D-amino acid oxidase-like deaminating enzyme
MRSPCTRRDLLAALLGLPAALAGCARRPPPLPDGEIVGASADLGHRLREPPPPRPADENWQRVGVVIAGGGIAGLSAAWRLARAGFDDFVLLELEPAVGGTSRWGKSPIISYPWGAHYLPAPMKENRALLLLLREMGVVEGTNPDGEPVYAEEALCRDPHERVFHRGHWYEGLYLHPGADEEDEAQRRAFFREVDSWVAWRDGRGRKAFALPVASGSDDAEVTALDRLSMAEWLERRGWNSSRLRWVVDYACRDDYGTTPEHTSAWAGLFYFASRRRKPGAESQPLLTWPEGNGRLAAHLARKARGKVRTGLAVADIVPTDPAGRRGVDVVALAAGGKRLLGFHAEQVIFAAPQFLTRYVLRPYRESPPAHVRQFRYGSWMVANLHLRDRPAEAGVPLCWDNVLYESPSLGYVVATHQRGLDFGPTVFTYYYPLTDPDPDAARRKLLTLGWAEWAEVALADLERAHQDIRGLTQRLDVMRWGHAMVRPSPGFVWGGARRAGARPYRGVHFAHSDLSGLALFEEAFYHGVRAAEEVLKARGREVTSIL